VVTIGVSTKLATPGGAIMRNVMGLQATFVLYLVIGIGVEAALMIVREDPPVARWFTTLTGILFWPLYVPILLAPPDETPKPTQLLGETSATNEFPAARREGEPAEQTLNVADAAAEMRNCRATADNRT
jgi:hypothetical protein